MKDEIFQVLEEAGTPLNYREITQRVIARGLWITKGKTPENSIAAAFTDDRKLGERSQFYQLGVGNYGLRSLMNVKKNMGKEEEKINFNNSLEEYNEIDAYKRSKTKGKKEKEFYDVVKTFLEGKWVEQKGWGDEVKIVVEVTANKKSNIGKGKWSVPDITVVFATKLEFPKMALCDLITFEIKTFQDLDFTAVYEALAHRRWGNRSYLLICGDHETQWKQKAELIKTIEEEAGRHGVGVVIYKEGNSSIPEKWEEHLEAERGETDPLRINDFFHKLEADNQRKIRSWLQ